MKSRAFADAIKMAFRLTSAQSQKITNDLRAPKITMESAVMTAPQKKIMKICHLISCGWAGASTSFCGGGVASGAAVAALTGASDAALPTASDVAADGDAIALAGDIGGGKPLRCLIGWTGRHLAPLWNA